MKVYFEVPTMPTPQGSMKAYVVAGRAHVVPNNAAKLAKFRADVQEAWLRNAPEHWPLDADDTGYSVGLLFVLPRPASHYNVARRIKPSAKALPTVQPDIDKLVRSVFDALTGRAWRDDAQVTSVSAAKHYVGYNGDYPKVGVTISQNEPL